MLVRVVATELAHALGQVCEIAVVADEGASLEMVASASSSGRPRRNGNPDPTALWAHALDTRQPLVLPAADHTSAAVPAGPALDEAPLVVVPILADDFALGVVALSRAEGDAPYTARERELLEATTAWLGAQLNSPQMRSAALQRERLARARAERARDHGEHRFHDVFAQACTPMALTTLEGKMLRANASLEDLLEHPAGSLEGHSVTDVTVPEDRDLVTSMLGLLRAGALSTARFEKRCWTASGSVVSTLLTTSLIKDDSGRSLYFFHQIDDLTRRKRVEAALAARDAEMRTLFDRSSVGTAAVNSDGTIRRVNAAFAEFAGRPAAELAGRKVSELWPAGDAERATAAMARASTEGRGPARFEQRFVRPDGRERWALVNVAGVADDSLLIVQVVDVTEAREASAERDALVAAVENAGDGIVALDAGGTIVRVNAPFAALFGRTCDEFAGVPWEHVVLRADQHLFRAALERGRAVGREAVTVRGARPGRPSLSLEFTLVAGTADSGPAHYCFVRDISERTRMLAQQTAIADLGQAALHEQSPGSLYELAVRLVARCLDLELAAVLERSAEVDELVLRAGVGWRPGLAGHARVDTSRNSQAGFTLATPEPVVVSDASEETRFGQPWLFAEHGVVSGVSVAIQGADRMPIGVLGAHSRSRRDFTTGDVTFVQAVANILAAAAARAGAEARARAAALRDPLTGRPNRTAFEQALEQVAAAVHLPGGTGGAVLVAGLDRFKALNELLGHRGADTLLVQAAERLESESEPGDLLAHLGGDVYGLLLRGAGEDRAAQVANRLVEAFERPFTVHGEELHVSVSIGIVVTNGARLSAGELLRQGEAALYRAKDQGRGRYELYDRARHSRVVDRVRLEKDLRRAIAGSELFTEYQPIVTVGEGKLVAVEALARWRHPTRGLVPPSLFIPLAEEVDLIGAVDRHVVAAACSTARALPDPVRVCVNLSAAEVARPGFAAELQATLDAAGVDPARLGVEITETTLLQSGGAAEDTLAALQAMGVTIGIDDFGTGYSSLGYLKRFALDVIKIDRSFVAKIADGEHDAAIVAAVIAMARALDIVVVAEGVERREQLEALARLRCDLAQGHLIGRPGDAASLLADEEAA